MKFNDFFTADAAAVFERAEQLCLELNVAEIDPEHIFFTLLECDRAQDYVPNWCIPQLRQNLEAYIYEHAGQHKGKPALAQRTTDLLDRAWLEVTHFSSQLIDIYELLYALAQDERILMGSLPEEYGIHEDNLRQFRNQMSSDPATEGKSRTELTESFARLRERLESTDTQSGTPRMDFYNFFSFSAKKAIYRASEICGQFNNQYLEPEHTFYSILNLRSCSAVQVLHQMGVNLPKLTYSIEAFLYEHAGTYKGNAVFSQRMITLLDTAYKEVKRLHHKEIGTTHLLIALSQDRSVFLKTLFEEHGLDSKKIRDSFLTHLKGYTGKNVEEPGIEIKRGPQETATQIVPPVCYDDTVKQILKNAEFTAQALGYSELTPAHLLYSSCLYAVEWWDQFGAAGIEPHVISGKLARMLRKDVVQRSESLALAPGACDVFGRAYALTLRSGVPNVTPEHFLQAILESDDPQVAEVFSETPAARGKLIEMLTSSMFNSPFHSPESFGAPGSGYDRLSSILPNKPEKDDPHVEDPVQPLIPPEDVPSEQPPPQDEPHAEN